MISILKIANSKVSISKRSKGTANLHRVWFKEFPARARRQLSQMCEGVSIVVCCHNSERLLPETLARLAAQQFTRPAPTCEVIVIDNASTDRTSSVARASWPTECTIPLRVASEPKLGLASARL